VNDIHSGLSNFRNYTSEQIIGFGYEQQSIEFAQHKLFIYSLRYSCRIIWIEVYYHIQDRTIWLLIEQLAHFAAPYVHFRSNLCFQGLTANQIFNIIYYLLYGQP